MQDVLDARQRVERQVADAGAGVDQHVVVEQEGGGPATAAMEPEQPSTWTIMSLR